MQLLLNIPPDLLSSLVARSANSGRPVEETILEDLREASSPEAPRPTPPAPERHVPMFYPEPELMEDEPYNPVPFPEVGVVMARIVSTSRLIPPLLPDDE